MHDAPSSETLTFWKVSNFCNIIIWAAISILIVSSIMANWTVE